MRRRDGFAALAAAACVAAFACAVAAVLTAEGWQLGQRFLALAGLCVAAALVAWFASI